MSGLGRLRARRKVARGQRELVPVRAAIAGTVALALVVLGGVLWTGWVLLGAHGFKHEDKLSSSTFFDLLRLAFAVVAGIGGVVALVIAYRKQRVAEDGAVREATKLHTDRFTAAATQLGSDSSAVQLAGVHALAGLADDAPTPALSQTCIDVLCAFLRMPYDPDPGDPPTNADTEQLAQHTAARHAYRSLREVRHTVIRIIGAHLRDGAEVSWQGHDLDFTGVLFDGGDLSGAVFTANPDQGLHGRVTFAGAQFTGGRVTFEDAKFTGGNVTFEDAKFIGGRVTFVNAKFTGGNVDFAGAEFIGGNVNFALAEFIGGNVNFAGAEFTGGNVNFAGAEFTGGNVNFVNAKFTGGNVNFVGAHGDLPHGLVDTNGRLPAGVIEVPPEWLPPQAPASGAPAGG